jgi:PAS domain S-box-containing protein
VKNRPAPGGNHIARQLEPDVSRRLSQFVSLCSLLAVAFGVWVLMGWALHIQILKSILPGQVAVKANTAVCFILVGVALWFLRKEQPPLASGWKLAAKAAAIVAGVVGLLSLLEFLWGWDLGIDQLLFPAGPEDIPGSVRPGLMSPIAALGFFWLGPALLLLHAKSTLGRWSAQLLPAMVATASVFGILDFVLDPNNTHTHISPVTALVLFLLSLGLMFARTQSGFAALVASETLGGALTRRLVPAAILVPLVVSWLRWKGELTGLYSEWTGLTMMTVFSILLLASLTAWTGFLVDRGDWERRQGEETISRLAAIVTSSNDAIIGKTLNNVVTSWNPGAEATYGFSAQEIIGQSISVIIPLDRREEFSTIMERVKQGQKVSHYETVWVRKDGQTIQVSLSVSPVKDSAGTIVGVSTIAPTLPSANKRRRRYVKHRYTRGV